LCLEAGAPLQLDSAEEHLRRAHELNKEENGPVLRLGEVALARGDLAAARRHFATVLATHAGNAPAHFYMGYIAWKENNPRVAREEFRTAVATEFTPPAGGVVGEGDTKRGAAPPLAVVARCDQLRALLARPRLDDDEQDMTSRYRELDRLLSSARQRVR
ncbi:MAG TPA: hypothetical protein VFZ21_15580, partial [Gemmatimonadaceae bacterium]|nr:hypothetical protein [Gemmatimonadaceae bacterium]